MRKFNLFLKRGFDIFASAFMILILTVIPVLIVIPILIKLTSKGPAVFMQERVGKDEKIFKIYKFRTMLIPEESFDKNGEELKPKERITKVGSFLRKTSLDELMQLFNIFKGDMSLVGPRPTLPIQIEGYNETQKRRHEMRPGLTGLAQVNGRNKLNWAAKIEYDITYIENFNFWLDIKIIFKTIFVVLKKEGIEFKDGDTILGQQKITEKEELTKK